MKYKLWLEFEEWQMPNDNDCDNDYFNAQVELENGKSFALNIWTFKFLKSSIEEIKQSQDCRYLICPDLIVEKLDRRSIEKCITQMIENDELKEEWQILDKDDLIKTSTEGD